MPIFMTRPRSEPGLESFERGHDVVELRRALRPESFGELDADQETEKARAPLHGIEKALLRKNGHRLRRRLAVKLAREGPDGGSPRAELPARQIHDPELPAPRLEADERAPAGQLDVVGVGGDREDVNRHGFSSAAHRPPRPRRRSGPRGRRSPPPTGSRRARFRPRSGGKRSADRRAPPVLRPAGASSPASAGGPEQLRPSVPRPCASALRAAPAGTPLSGARFRERPPAWGRAPRRRAPASPSRRPAAARFPRLDRPGERRPPRAPRLAGRAGPRRKRPGPGPRGARRLPSGRETSGGRAPEEERRRSERAGGTARGKRSRSARGRSPRPGARWTSGPAGSGRRP